ncbi:MAG: hypothetical protein RMK73_12130 [Geminicoccaceae bacterium]|nr:hypothetical protein [Geminicoccaceae bacterium]MDW8342221.1 hypothetical protein [Geminicoccaceae bacterium]
MSYPLRREPLLLLAQLERAQRDRWRSELHALAERARTLAEERTRLERSVAAEFARGFSLPGGPAPLGEWLAETHRYRQRLEEEAETLARREQLLEREIRAHHARARLYELLAERRRAAREDARARAERRALDELVGSRAAFLRTRERG